MSTKSVKVKMRKILSSIVAVCFFATNLSYAYDFSTQKLAAPSKFTSLEFRHSAQIEVGIRGMLKGLKEADISNLKSLGTRPITRQGNFKEQIVGSVLFGEGAIVEIEDPRYAGTKHFCVTTRILERNVPTEYLSLIHI